MFGRHAVKARRLVPRHRENCASRRDAKAKVCQAGPRQTKAETDQTPQT